jgi:hypothetical protein
MIDLGIKIFGKITLNFVPLSTSLVSEIFPFNALINCLQIASPNPTPSFES